MTMTNNLIDKILSKYQYGSKEHSDLTLHIMALEQKLYRELQVIEYELDNNTYEWLEETA